MNTDPHEANNVERDFELVLKLPNWDGNYLAYRIVRAPNAIGVVLIFHGFAESSARYKALVKFLVNLGWSVILIDFRGHGYSRAAPIEPANTELEAEAKDFSERTRIPRNELLAVGKEAIMAERAKGPLPFCGGYADTFISSFDEYLNDAHTAIKTARAIAETETVTGKVFIVGMSQGALIAWLSVLKLGSKVDGLCLLSGAFRIGFSLARFLKGLFGRPMGRWCPTFALPHGITILDLMSASLEAPVREEKIDLFKQGARRLLVRTATSGWFRATLLAQSELRNLLNDPEPQSFYLKIPTCLMYGRDDKLVSVRVIQEIREICCKAYSKRRKELKLHGVNYRIEDFEGKHEIWNDVERHEVFGEIGEWLRRVCSEGVAGVAIPAMRP